MASAAGTVRSVPIAAGVVVDVNSTTGGVAFRGYSLRATTTGIVNIRVNSDTGLILATVSLTAPGFADVLYPDEVDCEGDLWVEIVSGVWVGSIRFG